MRTDDTDETRCQAALRRHEATSVRCQLTNVSCRRHVFGEIEVMQPERVRHTRHRLVECIRQAGQHRVLALQRATQGLGVGDVDDARRQRRGVRGAQVDWRHGKTRFVQQLCGQVTDLAEAKNGNLVQAHRALSR